MPTLKEVEDMTENPTYDTNLLYMSGGKDDKGVSVDDVAEHFKDIVGGPQKIGKEFCLWALEEYKQRRPYLEVAAKQNECEPIKFDDFLATLVPKVDVKYKIYRLADFSDKDGTFQATVTVMLDWIDPSLKIVYRKGHEIDWEDHFWPKFEMLNTQEKLDWSDASNFLPKYKPDKKSQFGNVHRASMTYKFDDITIYTRLNFREFPFDYQTLEFTVKLLSVRLPDVLGRKDGVRPYCCDPTRWRRKDGGHELLKEADCLADFELLRLVGKGFSSQFSAFPENLDKDDPNFKKWETAKKNQVVLDKQEQQWQQYQIDHVEGFRECSIPRPDNTVDAYCDQYTMQVIIRRFNLFLEP